MIGYQSDQKDEPYADPSTHMSMSELSAISGSSRLAAASSDECVLSRLNEQQRRWYVALEASKIGHGGDSLLAQITGMDVETIRRGRRELDADLANRPIDRVRQAGGGRPALEKKSPRSRQR
jgi:hypothetical protein